jgi:HD-GYP domain-containing protein (c-di-GMP phosphodiesterase class II)
MTGIPFRTRIYVTALVGLTAFVLLADYLREGLSWTKSDAQTGIILLVMIAVAERFKIDFPNRSFHFSVSVGAILSLGTAFTLDPLQSAIIVIAANIAVDLSNRLQVIQWVVNASNLGLATFLAGTVYWQIAGNAHSPIDSIPALIATVIASTVYTVANLGMLSVIVAPVVGETPIGMWRANFSGSFVFVSLPMLGSLVPITAAESGFGVLILIVPLAGSHLALRNLRKVELETQATMASLTDALEVRDAYTSHHSERVTEYVEAILGEMPHVPSRMKAITIEAARIHDVGKIGIQDTALLKNGPLTDEEWREIRRHPVIGADIVKKLGIYRNSAAIVRHHHERWDGTGYPDGLKGEDIPLGSRIIAVADSFDAMTSNRSYRRARPFPVALEEIVKNAGTQYDPVVVEAFERAMMKPVRADETVPHAQPHLAIGD